MTGHFSNRASEVPYVRGPLYRELIYTAGDNNIGYWQYDVNGKINYTSLLPLVTKLKSKERL